MRSLQRFVVITLCGTMVWATTASAQKQAMGGDPWTFGISIRGDFTDNRDSSEFDAADNFDIYVIPRIDAILDTDRTVFDFFYTPEYRYRTDPSPVQNDYEWYHSLGLHLTHKASDRVNFKLFEKFDYTDDPSVDEGGISLRGDRSYKMNRARLETAIKVARTLEVTPYAANKTKRYDDSDVAAISDEDRTDFGLRAWQILSRTVGLLYEVQGSAFSYDSPEGILRDFDLLQAGLGVEKVFNPRLRAGVTAGAQLQSFDDNALDDQTEAYASARVEGHPSPMTTLKVEFERGIRDADAFPFASQLYTEFFSRADWKATSKVNLGLWVTLRRSEYNDVAPSAAESEDFERGVAEGNEDTVEAAAELAYAISDQMGVKLSQDYQNVDSEVSQSFDKNTTSLIWSYHF